MRVATGRGVAGAAATGEGAAARVVADLDPHVCEAAAFEERVYRERLAGARRTVDGEYVTEADDLRRGDVEFAKRWCRNVVCTVGAVQVAPGDYVVADGSAVVFVKAGDIERVLDAAEVIADRERQMVADLKSGLRPTEVMGKTYETMLKR